MEYLTIEEIKKHLNIEADFTDDDVYLESLANAAQSATEIYLDTPLSDYEDANGNLPRSIVQAMLLLIGTWYAIRESVSSSSMTVVPTAFEFLCDLHRNYSVENSLK